jgi:NB-ARC domain-containing protein/tetratricopeptide repeat protein
VLTQVLSGMGGVGKTQLAAWFARRLADRGKVDLVAWVSASTEDTIIAGYAEAATALDLADRDTDAPHAAERFKAWLDQTGRRWLVVLDDLAQPSHLSRWWPPASPKDRTLVTTRRRDAALQRDGRTLVDIELFTQAEARAYLVQALPGHPPATEVDLLAADLGHLPLALAQASAYIRDRQLSCEQYRSRLADRRRTLTELLPEDTALPDAQQATVAVTWSLSIEAADALRPEGVARPTLHLAAVLDPSGIPPEVFTTPATLAYLGAVADREVTVDDAREAVHLLRRLSLATIDSEGSVQVHALVQRATRDTFPDHKLGPITEAAADALLHLWPNPEPDTAAAAWLRANTAALYTHTGETLLASTEANTVLFRAGRSLGETGQVAAARNYFQQLLEDMLRVLGPDHPDTLATRGNFASWTGQTGDAAGAAEALKQLLADQVRVLGPDHPHTLTTSNHLADWTGEAGDAAGAAEAFEHLLADHLRVHGPDHPHTLATRGNLASWTGQTGDAAGAAEAFEHLLADHLRVHGPDHPDTLKARGNLAGWTGRAGDAAGAAEAFERLLADRLRVLGPDHPDTLATRNNLASMRGEAGDTAGAADALERLLADTVRVLGPDHPDTLNVRNNLAGWTGRAGDAARAAEALERLLADSLRVLGPDHPDTLATRGNLASWTGLAGHAAAGAEALEQLLADRLRVLGPDHPYTLTTRNNLAYMRGEAGDAAGAAEALERLLADRLRVFGPDHPYTLTARNNLAHWRGRADGE